VLWHKAVNPNAAVNGGHSGFRLPVFIYSIDTSGPKTLANHLLVGESADRARLFIRSRLKLCKTTEART
jgi:hypothetical protein